MMMMVDSRTEKKDEEGNDGEEDAEITNEEEKDSDNSKIDSNLSNISDGVELFVRSKRFDEELEMLDSDEGRMITKIRRKLLKLSARIQTRREIGKKSKRETETRR